MKMVIGGYAQGKLEYVKKKYNVKEELIFDCALQTKEEIEKINPGKDEVLVI